MFFDSLIADFILRTPVSRSLDDSQHLFEIRFARAAGQRIVKQSALSNFILSDFQSPRDHIISISATPSKTLVPIPPDWAA